jgi:hypothetical protein
VVGVFVCGRNVLEGSDCQCTMKEREERRGKRRDTFVYSRHWLCSGTVGIRILSVNDAVRNELWFGCPW